MKNDILGELLERNKALEDQFNKMNDSALQLMEINKEHQRINGELREENKRLQEECTYMTKKAYDFFSALLDIKELVVNNACLDESINKCVDDLIYYKCDELLDIVNKALEKNTITKEMIEKLRSDKE